MHWESDAEEAIKKVPAFVRGMARRKVESYVAGEGRSSVSLADVHESRRRFLKGSGGGGESDASPVDFKPTPEMIESLMSSVDEKGTVKNSFSVVETCAARFGCPMQVLDPGQLADRLVSTLEQSGLKEFLEGRIQGHILPHHKFKIALSGCPNACSQPQIRDFGVLARGFPARNSADCTGCRRCGEACKESAVDFPDFEPEFDYTKCIGCGDCIRACPCEALEVGQKGYTIMAGGKLGRHPQLAIELVHQASEDEVVEALNGCLELYMKRATGQESFTAVLNTLGADYVRAAVSGFLR